MSARDTLTGVFTDAGHKEFGQASEAATKLYDQIRREVLDDLARSGTGLAELANLVSRAEAPTTDARDLFHKIRGAALLQLAERFADMAAVAKHPKVRFTLDYAAQYTHKQIINPGGKDGAAQGSAGAEGDPGIVREGDADGLGVGGA